MEKTNNNVHFLKLGNDIVFGKSGVDYTLEPGKVYTPVADNYSGEVSLTISTDLQLPEKLYVTKDDKKFIDKTIASYSKSEKTMGVLMAGEKGTGKTVMAKEIALKSELPILTIDKSFHPRYLKTLFTKLSGTSMCVIFDEFDKLGRDYDSDYILQVFDGVSSSGNHLLLLTCNNTDKVNEYMLDRCGRIRYYREFDEMTPSMIEEILNDRLDDKSEIKPCVDFIVENFGLVSFDNVATFADEINMYPKETLENLFADMNISNKD